MIFAALAFLMTVVAGACIAIPLWRSRLPRAIPQGEAERSVYERQLAELKRDLANGVLAESEFQAALRDMESEQSANRVDGQPDSRAATRGHRLLAVASALVLMLAAGGLYWRMGNWRAGAEGVPEASKTAVTDMVQELSEKLHTTDRNDIGGWMTLGHAYVLMNRYQDALAAYASARRLTGDKNADVLAAYAEALTLSDPAQFMSTAAPLFEQVLKLDPTNVKALWYGGLAASQRGDNALAIHRWQTLLQQNLPPQYSAFVSKYIEKLGGSVTAPVAAAGGRTIHVHVALASAYRGQVKPDDTVFVFALPADARGGPPLAVRRLQAHDLPVTVVLSDKDAMIAGRNLSSVDAVKLVARISKDGSPLPQAGELSGSAIWKPGKRKQPVSIMIDSRVK